VSQLRTLIWLKSRLLRNSLRSSKAVVNRSASIVGMLIAFAFALIVALELGLVAFILTQPEGLGSAFHRTAGHDLPESISTEFIFFSIFGVLYLMWATVPLSLGGGKQFDPGKMLMYPITLRKLFLVDFVSEFTTLHSVFLVPAVFCRNGFRQLSRHCYVADVVGVKLPSRCSAWASDLGLRWRDNSSRCC